MNMLAFWLAVTGLFGVATLATFFLLSLYVRRRRTRRKMVEPDRPSFEPPSEDRQMEALLAGRAHDLVRSVLGKKTVDSRDYHAVIAISIEDALSYMESHCSVDQIAVTSEKRHDGYYALPTGNSWKVYVQERGVRFEEQIVQSDLGVFRHYIQHVLRVGL